MCADTCSMFVRIMRYPTDLWLIFSLISLIFSLSVFVFPFFFFSSSLSLCIAVIKPREGDPFDSFPKNFWQEFSSPFTDTPDENDIEDGEETTTHEPFPFFDEPAGSVNVTTHLGNSVHLHCRVNDLNGKTVSDISMVFSSFVFFSFLSFRFEFSDHFFAFAENGVFFSFFSLGSFGKDPSPLLLLYAVNGSSLKMSVCWLSWCVRVYGTRNKWRENNTTNAMWKAKINSPKLFYIQWI